MHAPIYGCARTHWHVQTAHAHTRHARTAHARTFTHIHTHWNACMHAHTHTHIHTHLVLVNTAITVTCSCPLAGPTTWKRRQKVGSLSRDQGPYSIGTTREPSLAAHTHILTCPHCACTHTVDAHVSQIQLSFQSLVDSETCWPEFHGRKSPTPA